MKQMNQPGQISDPTANVFLDAEPISHSKPDCSRGHELHQARRALGRNRIWVPGRLNLNDGVYKLDWYVERRCIKRRTIEGELLSVRDLPGPSFWRGGCGHVNRHACDHSDSPNSHVPAHATVPASLSLSL